jgi:preprotein translocase subunit SecG
MTFLLYATFVLFIIICVFLILLILIQKGRGGGLASAFGGGGGNTAFGSKTGDVLTWATSIAFGVFLLTAIALNRLADAHNSASRPAPATAMPTIPVGGGGGAGGTGGAGGATQNQQKPGGPIAPAKGGDSSLPQPSPAEPAPKPVPPASSQP